VALARRGHTDPGSAAAFLEGSERHRPADFQGMGRAVAETVEAIASGRKITVYGDFDVDGVAATTIMVTVLRRLGADCDWFIPDRQGDGYGLSPQSVADLAARGTGLLITVDCGIASADDVALARSKGMGVIVTDHHRPGDRLPDCAVLHPAVSGYPFEDLCGAAVASKFASALRVDAGLDPALDEDDLDLVALATVADVMPLLGENRRLVKEGLRVARRAERPGMRALIAECGLEPSRLSSADFGFRLGPRINAAGRIYRADAGVELFLSESVERASEIAAELGRANSERRRIEREVEAQAEKARREMGLSDPAALVLAGEDWHPGVVGIVAAKFARSHGVPSVIISIDGEQARGSARGVPGLDLHAAIGSVSGLLEGFGGHAAAAGLQLRTDRIPAFREALTDAVSAMVGAGGASTAEHFDAVVGGPEIGMDLAEELELLEPCGKGNPSLSLLIPSARIRDVQEIGDGKHCRFTVVSADAGAAGICFGRIGFGVDEETPLDLVAELSVNHFNGTSSAQLLVREAFPLPDEPDDPSGGLPGCEAEEWWLRFEAAYAGGGEAAGPDPVDRPMEASRIDGNAAVVLAELVSSGEPLVVATSDARRRWRKLGGEARIARFGGGHGRPRPIVRGVWAGSPGSALGEAGGDPAAGVLLTDFTTIGRNPEILEGVRNLLLFDPPASAAEAATAGGSAASVLAVGDPASLEFALAASADRHALTPALRVLYRDLRDTAKTGEGDEVSGEGLLTLLRAEGEATRSPERAALLLRVLVEAGLARTGGVADARIAGVVSSDGADLSRSPLFSEQERIHKEQVRFLKESNSWSRTRRPPQS
jgi:single-stranded-DNA-specific exonuclease